MSKTKKYSGYIPFIIGAILLYISSQDINLSKLRIGWDGYSHMGDLSLIISTSLYVIAAVLIGLKKSLWQLIYTIHLCLCSVSIISLGTAHINIGSGAVSLNLIPVFLLVAHYNLNPELKEMIKGWTSPSEKEIIEKEKLETSNFESSVESFKKKYKSKSKTELERIVGDSTFVPEAIQAAKELLED